MRRRFNRRAATPGAWSARQARLGGAEEVLGEQAARCRLLVPEHHQDNQLQLLEGKRVTRGGERALQDQLAVLRAQNSRLLQREQKAAALCIELRQLAWSECSE